MDMKNCALALLAPILMLVLVPAFAMAQETCVPAAFFGGATVNGEPSPSGLAVTATIDGQGAGSSYTLGGRYGYYPFVLKVMYADDDCGNAGTVEFFIEGRPAGTGTFESGKAIKLDLSAQGVVWCGDGSCNNGENCSSCSRDCGICPDSTGGEADVLPDECIPDWICSPWSLCTEDSRTRECFDRSVCGIDDDKPSEEQFCMTEVTLPESCEEGTTACVGDHLFECAANNDWSEVRTCENGCLEGACMSESKTKEPPVTGFFLSPAIIFGLVILALAILVAASRKIRKL
jgi:hypothetical protein